MVRRFSPRPAGVCLLLYYSIILACCRAGRLALLAIATYTTCAQPAGRRCSSCSGYPGTSGPLSNCQPHGQWRQQAYLPPAGLPVTTLAASGSTSNWAHCRSPMHKTYPSLAKFSRGALTTTSQLLHAPPQWHATAYWGVILNKFKAKAMGWIDQIARACVGLWVCILSLYTTKHIKKHSLTSTATSV